MRSAGRLVVVSCLLGIVLNGLSASLLPGLAQARDIYVDNVYGDDRNDGTQPETVAPGTGPCQTITRALKHADGGDRIILANHGQPYHESITLQGARHSGTEYAPFVIIGNGAILDGTTEVPSDAWEHFSGELFRFQPSYLSYQQLYLDGRPATRVEVSDEADLDQLEEKQWALYRGYVYFRTEETQVPQLYDLRHSGLRVGIALYTVRHLQIHDLAVQGFALDGINAHDSVFDASLIQVVSRGNGRSGISIGGACRLAIDACLVGDNSRAQIRGEGYSRTEVTNCDVLENNALAPAFTRDDGARISVDGSWLE